LTFDNHVAYSVALEEAQTGWAHHPMQYGIQLFLGVLGLQSTQLEGTKVGPEDHLDAPFRADAGLGTGLGSNTAPGRPGGLEGHLQDDQTTARGHVLGLGAPAKGAGHSADQARVGPARQAGIATHLQVAGSQGASARYVLPHCIRQH
jgi:hypothetical protein